MMIFIQALSHLVLFITKHTKGDEQKDWIEVLFRLVSLESRRKRKRLASMLDI